MKDQETVRRQERAGADLLGQLINCQSLPMRLDLTKWDIDAGAGLWIWSPGREH